MDYKVLDKPLSKKKMRKIRDVNGFITGVVSVDLNEVIDSDLEEFLDMLSILLTDTEILMDISYKIVGLGGENTLHIEVCGDASGILDED